MNTRSSDQTGGGKSGRTLFFSLSTALLLLIPVLAIGIVPNNQIFNAYLVWGDQSFDLDFFGTKLPTTWLVTLDAIVSVSFLALVALFWRWWAKRRREPDELQKVMIGSAFSVAGGTSPRAVAWKPATRAPNALTGPTAASPSRS